jgi:hypothetical protein
MVHVKHVTLLVAMAVFTAPGFGDRAPAQAVVLKVKPGEFVVDHPTLINLGFEWVIQGDDNRNANVDVSYRNRARPHGSKVSRSCACKANGSTRPMACLA